ncbi:MAG: PAS domain S-box protein [Bacteroidales bacterium]|nr:PAS domain S-box protein [Bacteroidales bacterium]
MKNKSINKTKEQLIIENEELLSRLAEVEDSLQAIRNGEVDAVVVSGPNGDQVYSICSSETPYRTFIEEMNEGAVTLSDQGIILYCNKRFAELVNQPIENVMGSYFNRFLVHNSKAKFNQLIAKQDSNRRNTLIVSTINNTYLNLSFQLLPTYLQGKNYVMIATDITQLKKKEAELIELHHTLDLNMKKLQTLRIDLINAKIEMEVQINKLKDDNRRLLSDRRIFNISES